MQGGVPGGKKDSSGVRKGLKVPVSLEKARDTTREDKVLPRIVWCRDKRDIEKRGHRKPKMLEKKL